MNLLLMKGVRELELMVNNLGYHYIMDVNRLLDYSGENGPCSQIQSLEETVATVIENTVEDEAGDYTATLELGTRNKTLIASKTLHFLMQFGTEH